MKIVNLNNKGNNVQEENNFREIKAGKIASETIYRSSSPLKGLYKREIELLSVKAGIKCILNLEDNNSAIEILSKNVLWYNNLVLEGNVIGLKMFLIIPSKDFNKKLKKGLQFMLAHKGPYLMHCFAGIDRVGFVAAVLQALMGATIKEICDDYLLSFRDVNASTNQILFQLGKMNNGVPVNNENLKIAVVDYLSKDVGLSKDEVLMLMDILRG